MTRKGNLIVGFVLLAVVAAVIIAILSPRPSYTPLYVYGGYRYFGDEQIVGILHDQYHLDIKGEFKKGTFAMSDDYDPAKQPVDCIFPGSRIGIDYFKQKHPGVMKNSAVVAQDRIVVYTWQELLPALENAGLVYSRNGVWYLRMKDLVDAMVDEKQWRDINAEIPGYVRVESTDPLTSSSGLQWLAFLGTYMVSSKEAGGKILTNEDLEADSTILKRLHTYWENQGTQADTTGNLFPRFITSGTGIPMIVAYESSFTDWYSTLPADQKALASKIVGIYPETTINIEHTLASLTPACTPLLSILTNDAKINELAWTNHGLHPQGYMITDPPVFAPWIALSLPVVPEPKKDVTDAIQNMLKQASSQ